MSGSSHRHYQFVLFFIVFCLASLIFGCGGGGGSGGSATTSGLSYNGLTTPAAIDSDNATDIMAGSVSDGVTGATVSDIKTIASNRTEARKQFAALKIGNIIEATTTSAVSLPDPGDKNLGVTPTARKTESDTFLGPCGGSASTKFTVDDQTGEFTGEIHFNKHCEEDIHMDGNVDVSGAISTVTLELTQLNMDFDMLSCSYANESVVMDGDMSISHGTNQSALTMNFNVKDNSTEKIYSIDDYLFTYTEYIDYVDVTVTGTYYHPDYGYVTLETVTPMKFEIAGLYPYEGSIAASGKNGSAGGPTKALITFIDEDSFSVSADTTGNGAYDWHSDVLYWEEM